MTADHYHSWPEFARRSFLVRKHIQPSLKAVFSLVNGRGIAGGATAEASGSPRMTLTRFRRIYAVCPDLFAVREILARHDVAAVEQSPERRAMASMQAAVALPGFPDSPDGMRPVARRVRRNLKSAAPSKRVHVVGGRPASPEMAVPAEEQAARDDAEATRASRAVPLAGGTASLLVRGELERGVLPRFVPRPSDELVARLRRAGAAASEAGSSDDDGGGFVARSPGGASAGSDDDDGGGGGGFLAVPGVSRGQDPTEPGRVDIVRRPSTQDEAASPARAPPADLEMVEVTLRPVGTSMQRSAQRQRRFLAELLAILQREHDGLPQRSRQTTLPGAQLPAPASSAVPLHKQADPSKWRGDFDPAGVQVPYPAHVPGVGCLCGLPSPAEDYPFAACSSTSHPADEPVTAARAAARDGGSGPGPPAPASSGLPACSFGSVEAYLSSLPWYVDQIRHVHTIAAREPRFADTMEPVHPAVRMAMAAR